MMPEYIFQGIILILFSIGVYIIAILIKNGQKVGNYTLYDGTITDVNPNTKNITVSYRIDKQLYSYTYSFHDKIHSDFVSMPEVGLKVRLMIDNETPEKPFHIQLQREMGRGLNSKRKYRNHSSSDSRKAFVLLGFVLLVLGLHQICYGLGII